MIARRMVIAGVCLLLFMRTVLMTGSDPPRKQDLSVTEIGKNVRLVGVLGQPLGTMMTAVGQWKYPVMPTKAGSIEFTITLVNGQQLDKPIRFDVAQVSLIDSKGKDLIGDWNNHRSLDGQTWTVRVYETGESNLHPQEYYTERGHGPVGMPSYFGHWTPKLHGFKAEPGKAPIKALSK